jgi:hypothetical protein
VKNPVQKAKSTRRRLLTGVGASGLAAAAAVFGRGTPAEAANWGCCDLYYAPPNMSYSTCTSSARHWVWQCTFGTVGPIYRYNCCEVTTPYGSYVGSAAKSTCISNCG